VQILPVEAGLPVYVQYGPNGLEVNEAHTILKLLAEILHIVVLFVEKQFMHI